MNIIPFFFLCLMNDIVLLNEALESVRANGRRYRGETFLTLGKRNNEPNFPLSIDTRRGESGILATAQ